MYFFERLKNIIRSNINSNEKINFDFFKNQNSYENDFDSSMYENFNQNQSNYQTQENLNSKEDIEAQYYANLELPYGASFDEIKKSYRKLLKKYHPDKFHNDEKKYKIAQDLVVKLNMAYNYFEEKYKK